MSNQAKLLVVDDEPFNIEILREYLEDNGYQVVSADDGDKALDIIDSNQHEFEAVLLDRMMPNLDGMEVLKALKKDQIHKNIPVIMQTAAAANNEIKEGIEAGAYYYLTKPYEPEILISIVNSAVQDYTRIKKLSESNTIFESGTNLITNMSFSLKTLEEAENVVAIISKLAPNQDRLILGLTELLINAIEHGNLEIGYKLKTELLANKTWKKEIETRLKSDKYHDRAVHVECDICQSDLKIKITDQGDGFDFKKYMDIDAERLNDNHGRGIAMAAMVSFDKINYIGSGNEVHCQLDLS